MAVPYQDILAPDGTTSRPGYRDCAGRWAILQDFLASHPMRSALDFGANAGYFSRQLARRGVQVTAVDTLPALARAASPAITVHRRKMGPQQVAALPRTDLVLALSVLHHNTDWPALLMALRGRSAEWLIVETPHPEEPLRQAAARDQLAEIDATLRTWGEPIGTAPGVRTDHQRTLYAIRTGVLRGTVATGNGNNSRFWEPQTGAIAGVLGYQPVAGSLNLRLPFDGIAPLHHYLGPPHRHWHDPRRPGTGKQGGDYQFWRARFGCGPHAIEAHVMVPGVRGHRWHTLELVAPFRLRDRWDLKDGDQLWVRFR